MVKVHVLKIRLFPPCFMAESWSMSRHSSSNKHLKNTKLYSSELLRTE